MTSRQPGSGIVPARGGRGTLDRLWRAAGLVVSVHGLRIGCWASDPDLLLRLRELIPYAWEPAGAAGVDRLYSLISGGRSSAGEHGPCLLYVDGTRLAGSADVEDALLALELDLHQYVGEQARERLFVHAGVVGWGGRAIVLPGRPMAGKSTLVSALLRAGATYYSDECAALDRQGRVHPFPRRLAMRGSDGAPARRYVAAELGARPGSEPLPVGLIAFARYQPGAHWCPRSVAPGPAALALVRHTVDARRQPEALLATLAAAVSGAQVLRGRRGEAAPTAALLLRRIAQ